MKSEEAEGKRDRYGERTGDGAHICSRCEREAELEELRTLIFGIVRNSAVYPVGVKLGRSEREITLKVFEVIEEIRAMMDFDRMREYMALAEDGEKKSEK